MIYRQYIDDVLTGLVVAGKLIRLAAERHMRDIARQNTAEFPYYFDEAEGARWVKLAQLCHHWKGSSAKQKITLEPWQQFYFMELFGWRRPDGTRRFRSSYLEIGRKNGKTTMCAVKAIGHIMLDKEAGAQVYFTATKEEQARIGFNDTKEIIRATPGLATKFKIWVKSITSGNSFIRPLGSDSDTQDGFDPSYGIIDEYHAHPTSGMLNVLESGMGSRKSPLIDIITTAGFNQQGPCYTEVREASLKILQGIITDETHLALIYTLDEDDDWEDETNWVKANPNLGVSVRVDFLRDRFVKAKNEGGSKEVDFKTKNLNIWTGSERTWIPDEVWMRGSMNIGDMAGLPCYGALDLASVRDICAFVLMFHVGNKYHILPHFFVPEETAKDKQNYLNWIKAGQMTKTPGNVTDYDYIRKHINDLAAKYNILSIAYDRWNASQLIINLQGDGFTCSPFGQGFGSMSAPTKQMEAYIYEGAIIHGGNPVMRWMMQNVMIETNAAGDIKVNKAKSKDKVDGVVSAIMALGELMTREQVAGSVYDGRGIRTI